GYNSGSGWIWVTLGFAVSAVFIPILGIMAHAKLQGTMLDFGNKVHPKFSLVFCIIIYLISIALPGPRTESVTYEIGIMPYLDMSSLTFSIIYFALVLLFVLNRSRLINILGKYLTPLLILLLIMLIGVSIFGENIPAKASILENSFTEGIIEGYQTFDAIGAIVIGAVLIISLNLSNNENYNERKKLLKNGGILAGLALFLIYAALIYVGSCYSTIDETFSRTEFLSFISYDTLGSGGHLAFSILMGLACFTTAVGIVTGTSDFARGLFKNSHKVFVLTAALGCILGIIIGQFNVDFIIKIAIPVLYFIYPITIVLILLNVLRHSLTSVLVFRTVVITTIIFSIPDFLISLNIERAIAIRNVIPLGGSGLGWLPPAILAFIAINSYEKFISVDMPKV
ncbi:MAG: branched-chain amino acid transport system II carrier protein, partial [Leeuwenhoekiella sp.]